MGPNNKRGRAPPTSPTLRPRVLPPRDHFAHRGGGRAMIMHKSIAVCNPKIVFFEDFFGPTKHRAKLPTNQQVITGCHAAGWTRCCAKERLPHSLLGRLPGSNCPIILCS